MKKIDLHDSVVCGAVRRGMAEQAQALKAGFGVKHVGKTARIVIKEVGRVEMYDPAEIVGAKLIRNAAVKMAVNVGDGSTTAAVLAEAICSKGLELIEGGADPEQLVRGIEIGVRLVCNNLNKAGRPLIRPIQVEKFGRFCGGSDVAAQVAKSAQNADRSLDELLKDLDTSQLIRTFLETDVMRKTWTAARLAGQGAVPGGGIGLWHAADNVSIVGHRSRGNAIRAGIELVRQACREPLRCVVENFECDRKHIENLVRRADPACGFDAATGRLLQGDDLNIIDPVPVLNAALKTASNFSGCVLLGEEAALDEDSEFVFAPPEPGHETISGLGPLEVIPGTELVFEVGAAGSSASGRPVPDTGDQLSASRPTPGPRDLPSLKVVPLTRPKARTVSTGFSAPESPAVVCDAHHPLRCNAPYLFWMEIGEPVPGSIERQPVELQPLEAGVRLRVVLFDFNNEIELTRGQDSGDFIQRSDGTLAVARQPLPAKFLSGVEELAERRLFFPVQTPARAGEYRFRCHIYHGQTLLQARVIHVAVSATPVARDQALYSVLDFNLCSSLAPGRLGRTVQPALNVLLNEGSDGSHTLRFCASGKTSSAHFDGEELSELINRIRMSLNEVSWGNIGPWQNGGTYQYPSGKKFKALCGDLAKLAEAGWQIYSALATKLHGDELTLEEMEKLLAASTAVEVVHRESARVYLPAAMIYDDKFDIDGNWSPCPDFEQAFAAKSPLWAAPCFTNGCRRRGANTLCPSNFWGYRHVLGFPLSLPPEMDARTDVAVGPNRALFAAVALDLSNSDRHLDALRQGGWNPVRLDTRKAVYAKLAQFVERPAVIYFYCHGGVDRYGAPFLRVGKPSEPPLKYGFLSGFKWEPPRPLVILNGCRTAALLPDKAMDMITHFIRTAHASGVIGTEITIFESLAQRFAEYLLGAVLDGRTTVGEAVRQARLNLLQQGNPLGLVYVPFVMNDLRFAMAP